MNGVFCAEKKRYRKVTRKNGNVEKVYHSSVYYIRYREDGKLKSLNRNLHPDFKNKKEGDNWILSNIDHIAKLINRSDILRHIAWKNKHHNFEKLVEIFVKKQKEPGHAPNSYKSNVFYLENFILPYYLSERGLGDMNEWFKEFENFKDWLALQENKKGKILAIATQNSIIRTLNKFISILADKGYVTQHVALIKCKCHPKSLLNTRGYEDIITKEEYKKLLSSLGYSRDFFAILYNTGMRFNELFSLPYSAIHDPETLPEFLGKRIRTLNKHVYGYIVLQSQITDKVRKRNKNGGVERKPLKSCKKIHPKNSRLIPITDKESWNIIVENYNRALEEHEDRKYKSNKSDDYFLFDVEYNKLRRDFAKHCSKGFHAARHSFITYSISDSKMSETEIRLISGHKSEAYEKYVHIYEQLVLESTKNKKGRGKLKLVA